MSLPHTPAWPFCSLLLFSSPSLPVSQLSITSSMPTLLTFPFPSQCWAVGKLLPNPPGFFYPPQISFPHPREGRSSWHLPAHGAAPSPFYRDPPAWLLPREFTALGVQISLGRQEMDGRGAEIIPLSSPLTVPLSHPCLISTDFGDHLPRSPTDPRGINCIPSSIPQPSLGTAQRAGMGVFGKDWEYPPLPCEPPTSRGSWPPIPTGPRWNLRVWISHGGGEPWGGDGSESVWAGSERFILYMNDF